MVFNNGEDITQNNLFKIYLSVFFLGNTSRFFYNDAIVTSKYTELFKF